MLAGSWRSEEMGAGDAALEDAVDVGWLGLATIQHSEIPRYCSRLLVERMKRYDVTLQCTAPFNVTCMTGKMSFATSPLANAFLLFDITML